MHFGGGHHGGFARSHAIRRSGFAGHRSFATRGGANFGQMRNAAIRSGNLHAGNVHNAFNSLSRSGALRNGRLLSNPAARAQMAAAAALGGWHGGAAASGWWQHAGGGYGWVGPLFWPFAYNDIYDYAIWGDDIGFWGYGYPDIYAGIFAPYGYDDLRGYFVEPRPGRRSRGGGRIEQMCGNDSRSLAGLPIDQIAAAVQPTAAQGAALDELGNASIAAAQSIRAACPTQVMLTAPSRLAAMQQRIEAMIAAAATVQPPLEKFYGLLDDEQKARLNALAEDQRKASAAGASSAPSADNCSAAQPAVQQWPTGEIDARLHLNDTQRAALGVLQNASADAAQRLQAACKASDAMTPPARLAAIAKRLDTMLQAVKDVRAALEAFYATLDDEQKAQFEAIGPRRSA
ncbi:hypothetical protein CI41S_09020 [Bradyrhizobium ivorense]|nr:hypothetical protein CI41S_09020 [Bradyrhizobium ivorense]